MTTNFGLIILDGWGIGDKSKSDAVFNANTPYMDYLMATYPNATLLIAPSVSIICIDPDRTRFVKDVKVTKTADTLGIVNAAIVNC